MLPEIVVQLQGLALVAQRLVSARLAIASAAVVARPSGDWSSCLSGAAALAGSFAEPLPVRVALGDRANRIRGVLALLVVLALLS